MSPTMLLLSLTPLTLPLGSVPLGTGAPTIAIPDGDSELTLRAPIAAAENQLHGVRVTLDLTHPYAGDLTIRLGHDADDDGTIDIEAPLALHDTLGSACPVALDGAYAFTTNLDALAGRPSTGSWVLVIADDTPGDSGSVRGWSVQTDGGPY